MPCRSTSGRQQLPSPEQIQSQLGIRRGILLSVHCLISRKNAIQPTRYQVIFASRLCSARYQVSHPTYADH